MRSNGLTASAYTPVADLDPRVADALLGELKSQGVAAYTKPVESTSASGFDRPEYRVNVQDRLYVDAGESERVKSMISDRDPALVSSNEDLTWAQIVAGFDQPMADDDVHPWPVTEDLDWSPVTDTRNTDLVDEGSGTRSDDRRADLRRWLSRRDATGPVYGADDTDLGGSTRNVEDIDTDDSTERFVPPPPPPLPRLEPWQQLAWVGLIGGPLLLLASVLFSVSLPTWIMVIATAGFIGGFIALVATMDNSGGSEDDPDHGAVL